MNLQLYSVLEEDEENWDESRSHSAKQKISSEFSSINNSSEGDIISTQLVFFYITEPDENSNVKKGHSFLQSESKIWEFSRKELISMYIEKEYSFVLTSKNDVLLIGNFASMLNIPDTAKPEFLKLPFLNQMKIVKISWGFSCALFLSKDGKIYSWGKDPDNFGILGWENTHYLATPSLLRSLSKHKIVDFSLGAKHVCAIDKDGRLFTWGFGDQGELGHGYQIIHSDVPLKVECLESYKIKKATATIGATLFLTWDNIFGVFTANSKVMFHSIIDFVPSEIFNGLITEEKLLILTHDLQLFQIDTIFEDENYEKDDYIIVGFQDSLMLISKNKTVIQWEIMSLEKWK
jgi:hypothetical protein